MEERKERKLVASEDPELKGQGVEAFLSLMHNK
jgi:hypothetical protein